MNYFTGFIYRQDVAFSDTDAGGVAHFTSLLKYVENAEHAAMKIMGFSLVKSEFAYPRVHIDCDYKAPLFFGDQTSVRPILKKIGDSSLTWDFSLIHHKKGTLIATGSMVTVRLDKATGMLAPFNPDETHKLQRFTL